MGFHRDLADRDLHAPSNEKVENNSAGTIVKFRAVKFNGFGTAFMQIELGNGATDSIRGITQDNILNTAGFNTGYITALGILTDVDTSGFLVNDVLYAGAGGVLQTAVNGTAVALVLVSHATNGIIYVRVEGTPQVGTGIRSKAGNVAAGSFSGTPKKATVTFSTAFPSSSYAINISGIDARSWTYESKTAAGFIINANAATALTGEVSWEAIQDGESN